VAPWDSVPGKHGSKNIRLSRNERPSFLRRRDLNHNDAKQIKLKTHNRSESHASKSIFEA
jgi:hypothetical protein